MSTAIAMILLLLFGVVIGVTSLLSYMVTRMLRSDGWDKSNITNALRLLSHVVLHPEDFGRMYYIDAKKYGELLLLGARPQDLYRPFWYINKDELSDVVRTRP